MRRGGTAADKKKKIYMLILGEMRLFVFRNYTSKIPGKVGILSPSESTAKCASKSHTRTGGQIAMEIILHVGGMKIMPTLISVGYFRPNIM